MSVQVVLLIILLILMSIVGGKKGAQSFFILLLNFIILFIMFILIGVGLNPITVTVCISAIITLITLFSISGTNKKTVSSLISVMLVVMVTVIGVYEIGINAQIQGFGFEQAESIAYYSVYIGLDFTKIVICEIIIGLLGAITDVSISISSSLNELYIHNPEVSKKSLIKSGINIGRDILGTMGNTLLFAFISEFITLIIFFRELHYTASVIINKKVFCAEVFQILCSGIGVILIIPVTAFIAANILLMKKRKNKNEEKVITNN